MRSTCAPHLAEDIHYLATFPKAPTAAPRRFCSGGLAVAMELRLGRRMPWPPA
jgi:hypothetical protein